jgi:serine/threonine protein kinase
MKGLMDMIGQLLAGRYLILEALGMGGFSETYLARDKYLPDYPLCVVKRLQGPSDSPVSPEVVQQLFATEARLLDQLGRNQAQIPTLLAYGHEPEQTYMVQTYIVGESLDDWMARGIKLTSEAAIDLLLNLLPVLNYIHGQQVIHHDIKPSNLIYCPKERKVVLIDFGAACGVSEPGTVGWANSTLAIGTPGYMSVEQEQGRVHFNNDLYALGMVVIQLITGIDPCQLQRDPVSGHLNWQDNLPAGAIDPQLSTILNQMVRISTRDRYQRAADVIAALRALPQVVAEGKQASGPTITRQLGSGHRRGRQQLLKSAVGILLMAGSGTAYTSYFYPQKTAAVLAPLQLAQRTEAPEAHLPTSAQTTPTPRMRMAPNHPTVATVDSDRGNSDQRLRTVRNSPLTAPMSMPEPIQVPQFRAMAETQRPGT